MNVNVKYKNSVFSLLFGDPDILRELYSAIEGISLPPDTPIAINTLSDVLYMEQINDISFTIDNHLVILYEHQSTINPNMPLRLLMYIAHVYEKIIDRHNMYKTKLEKIPVPEFIVLYNGREPYPDRSTVRLSSAFKEARGLLGAGSAVQSLELVVQVYNINQGHNVEILEKSRTLGAYSAFIEKVREYEQTFTLEEAMKKAVKYCVENDILKTFLETHSSEVFNMLLTEWNTEEAKIVWREEGREDGLEEGLAKGREEGIEEGLARGRMEIVRNAMTKGIPLDLIYEVTGIDIKSIQNIQAEHI
jgi:predicted transposase YdaD